MKKAFLIVSVLILFAGCSTSQAESGDLKEEIKAVLKENPEIILEIIKENDDEVLNIISGAVIKKQARTSAEKRQAEERNPKNPVIDESRPIRGNPKAPVTIVEYSDFQCPFCKRATSTVEAVLKKYEGKVRLFYKHLPLSIHSNAALTAKYFEAIAMQDHKKAWRFHDLAFERQSSLNEGESALIKLAKEAGADMNRLAIDVKKKEVTEQVKEDIAEANRFGFTGTPTFLINGLMLVGAQPEQAFSQIIDAAIRKSGN